MKHAHRGSKGGEVTVELYAFPLMGQEDQVEHVVVIAHDITERKRSEEAGKSI